MKNTKTSTRKAAKPMRKTKKNITPITTTSVAFKTAILEALKEHDICKKDRLSVSWIINRLIDKFLAGEIVLELE